MLRASGEGRVVHLSACQSLKVPPEEVSYFRRATNVDGLLGYTGYVGWIEGAALDLMLLEKLAARGDSARPASVAALVTAIKKRHPALAKSTTFDGYGRSETS